MIKKMVNSKKAQFAGDVIKYMLVGIFSVAILVSGYKMVSIVREKACQTEISKFEIDLKGIDKSLRFGAKELQSYVVPCQADRIYFFDLGKNINPDDFRDIPLLKDSIATGTDKNVFLIKEGEIKRSFHAGNMEMIYPYNICFVPNFGKISFSIEGTGKSVKVRSACNQPECTAIPAKISDEDSRKVIQEAIGFGCANCPTDLDDEMEKLELTRQNVEIFRRFLYCDGITDVQIIIKPKKGSKIKYLRYYEFLPKDCIDDLKKYLAEDMGIEADVKGDPLILWHFSDLGDEKKISYKLNTDLSEDCRQAINGLGVAHFEGEIVPPEKINTPPTIGGLPDVELSGIGLTRSVIINLWRYAQDKETYPKDLLYSITGQTNPDLVECRIRNNKHVDCEVKQNANGISIVTVQVDDRKLQNRGSFKAEVSQSCKKHARKQCVGNDLFWFDSCGKKGALFYDCKDNTLRKNCKDAECCIGSILCKEPVPTCKDECVSGGTRCVGSSLQTCSDSNNDGCEDWGKAADCGSDYCDDFGSWTCKNSFTKIKSKICYNKGCSEGKCYSNQKTESEEESCSEIYYCVNGKCKGNMECVSGNCQLKKGCDYNNPPCDSCYQCIENNCQYIGCGGGGDGGG